MHKEVIEDADLSCFIVLLCSGLRSFVAEILVSFRAVGQSQFPAARIS